MLRLLKRWLAPWLPYSWREWLKRRLENRISGGPLCQIEVTTEPDAVRCTFDREWSFRAPLDCAYDFSFLTDSRFLQAEFSGLARGARQGGVLFDIGAYAGIVSALFCAARPHNRAFSFEPSPLSQARVQAIRALNGFQDRMQLEPVAIGREKATLEMLVDPAGGMMQVQRFKHSMWAEPQVIQVAVETIPGASARLGVVPDFIKLDIEGYEYEAIDGAVDFLREHRPLIFLELHLNYLDERGLSARHVVEQLAGCGYRFTTSGGEPLSPRAVYGSPLQNIRLLARAD